MKIHFYGATPKVARKKANIFIKQLDKLSTEERPMNVTAIKDVIVPDKLIIPNAYRFQVSVDYSYTS